LWLLSLLAVVALVVVRKLQRLAKLQQVRVEALVRMPKGAFSADSLGWPLPLVPLVQQQVLVVTGMQEAQPASGP